MASKPPNIVIGVFGWTDARRHGQASGHNVHILEQYPSSIREGQAAGMSMGFYGQKFLEAHDLLQHQPHFVVVDFLRIFDGNLKVTEERRIPFKLTNWKTLYHRLRSNFGGPISEYVPTPSQWLPNDGHSTYEVGRTVTSVSCSQLSVLEVNVRGSDGQCQILNPDLVIAADGANSGTRNNLFPNLSSIYSGYLTWHGVTSEKNLSRSTRDLLENNCIRYRFDRRYIVVYINPGENGSINRDERHVNLVWYYNCSENSDEYNNILTDVDGIRHMRTVPFGKVQPAAWANQREDHRGRLAAPIKEILDKIGVPFVTAISDCISPRASFYNGEVLLVGDSLALFRPHSAQSTNQAAFNCLSLEKYLQGTISL